MRLSETVSVHNICRYVLYKYDFVVDHFADEFSPNVDMFGSLVEKGFVASTSDPPIECTGLGDCKVGIAEI